MYMHQKEELIHLHSMPLTQGRLSQSQSGHSQQMFDTKQWQIWWSAQTCGEGARRGPPTAARRSPKREQLMPALVLVPSARRHSVERARIWITSVRGGSSQLFVRQGQGAGQTMGGCLVEAELVLRAASLLWTLPHTRLRCRWVLKTHLPSPFLSQSVWCYHRRGQTFWLVSDNGFYHLREVTQQ